LHDIITHSKEDHFRLYPLNKPKSPIRCFFGRKMEETIKQGLRRVVDVSGIAEFNKDGQIKRLQCQNIGIPRADESVVRIEDEIIDITAAYPQKNISGD